MTENGQRRQSQLILFDEAERIEQRDRRRLQWATEIMAEEPEEISYLHAGLCMAALPHRRPAREFEPWTRTNGDYRLTVTPGWLTPKKGTQPQSVSHLERRRGSFFSTSWEPPSEIVPRLSQCMAR